MICWEKMAGPLSSSQHHRGDHGAWWLMAESGKVTRIAHIAMRRSMTPEGADGGTFPGRAGALRPA
jgi:hypothetical protein